MAQRPMGPPTEMSLAMKVLTGALTTLLVTAVVGGWKTYGDLRDGQRDQTAAMLRMEDRLSALSSDRYTGSMATAAHALMGRDVDAVRGTAMQALEVAQRMERDARRAERTTTRGR